MERSTEQLETRGAPGGPIDAAGGWIAFVLADGDLRQAWPLTEESFRRKLVAAWVAASKRHPNMRGHEPRDLVDTLSKRDPSRHYLWPGFADAQIQQFRTLWSNVDLKRWRWASQPISPGFERVLLVDPAGEASGPGKKNEASTAIGFVMRNSEDRGWQVAGIAEPEV